MDSPAAFRRFQPRPTEVHAAAACVRQLRGAFRVSLVAFAVAAGALLLWVTVLRPDGSLVIADICRPWEKGYCVLPPDLGAAVLATLVGAGILLAIATVTTALFLRRTVLWGASSSGIDPAELWVGATRQGRSRRR